MSLSHRIGKLYIIMYKVAISEKGETVYELDANGKVRFCLTKCRRQLFTPKYFPADNLLMPLLVEIGINLVLPFEVQAGCDIACRESCRHDGDIRGGKGIAVEPSALLQKCLIKK